MPPEASPHYSDPAPDAEDVALHRMVVPATNEASRAAIQRIVSLIDTSRVRREDADMLEIALAEVFNNIVEHAYADEGDGAYEVTVEMKDPGMHITIWDDGEPMPSGRLPGGQAADPDLAAHEQAEGGYGLFLIRQLARKLRYERVNGRNRLSFRVRLDAPDEDAA